MVFNSEQLLHTLARLTPSKHFWVAYSGGLDSHVLLHSLVALRGHDPTIQVQALHIHHGLSPNADAWVAHCQQICTALKVSCHIQLVAVKPEKNQSLEEAARIARYVAMAKMLSSNECLLTAHNQNDQAETVLLQLLRGAGIKGLAAMPEIKRFYQGWLVRPLLHFTRAALTDYARAQQLNWIEDETNYQPHFDRNYLRQNIFPLLQQRWPAVFKTFARSAQHCAQGNELLNELAQLDLLQVKDMATNTLIVSRLIYLTPERQANVLRVWLQQANFRLPSAARLKQLQHDLLSSRNDAMPKMVWDGLEIRRYRDALYASTPLSAHDASWMRQWDLQQPLALPSSLGVLTVKESIGEGLLIPGAAEEVTVRFRQGGERCRLVGRDHSHSLKHLFQEWGVPPWLRDRVPLIYVNDQLAAVVGYCVCEGFAVAREQRGIVIMSTGSKGS